MALQTVGDLRELSHDHLDIQHANSSRRNGEDTSLSSFNALIWSAHSTPHPDRMNLSFLDPDLQAFFQTPAGKALLKFGHIRGDVGAHEISLETRAALEGHNFRPLMLSPRMGGRTSMDHNRPLDGALLFPVPTGVHEKLKVAYGNSMNALFAYMTQYSQQLLAVLQPHTMGSGEFDEARVNELSEKQSELAPLVDTDFSGYERDTVALVDAWDDVYSDGCNSGPARPDVCIPTIAIPDQDFGLTLADHLREIGIEGKFNAPFSHVPGYPGTRLAQMAGEQGVPQVTADFVKRHLLPFGTPFRASTFEPNRTQAARIGRAMADATNRVHTMTLER